MDTPHDIPVRSARDRVIDLVGIGDTYPLTDLEVVADNLQVAVGGTAKVPIENAQAGVTYQLCDPKGEPLDPKDEPRVGAFRADGEDATLVLETPKVAEDVTYRIRAEKKSIDPKLPPALRLLDEGVPVKVGINTRLSVEILNAPLLDPVKPTPRASDPRIVPYGAGVEVQINNTQEGVQYWLILDEREAKEVAGMGNLGPVILPTGPMVEDAVIQVRATKEFASEDKKNQTVVLDAKVYLKVMADPALPVSVQPSPLVEYKQDATIGIGNTQKSAKYLVYVRAVPDADFVRDSAPDGDMVRFAEKPRLQVRRPERPEARLTPEGYAQLGYAQVGEALPGTGGDLKTVLKALTDDVMVFVQALKEHQVDPDNAASAITSAIWVEQAAVALVRPNPIQPLTLRVPVTGAQTGDTMQVSGGQPGVFYFFRPASASADFSQPAYFHKVDAKDDKKNKGVDQLAVEVDFAIADDPDTRPADPATAFPRPPLLAIAPIATGTGLSIRAVKAQTTVEASAVLNTQIPTVPAIHADQAVIDCGSPAKILIPASDPKDLYLVTLAEAAVRPEIAGDSTEVTVITEPLTADTTFEVVAARPADKGPRVERVMQVSVLVRPDTTLAVSAKLGSVSRQNGGTDILVQGSQQGVLYQLMSGQAAIGAAVPGTGADLALPTGPIAAETTFSVAAARTDNAQITAVLKAQATVKLEPDPGTGTPEHGTGTPDAGTGTPDPGTGTP